MINIKNIDGSLLYAAPVTKDAVFHHELMSSEYIELVFNEVTVIDIPIGAYVEYNGSRYTVTNPVTPDIIDGGYKYSIQFKADWMRWEGITYFYINEFSQKNETSWSMTATPDLFLQMIVENISRATGKTYTFSYDSSLTATKDLQFNNTTVLEALSMVADAFETEWWIEGTVIHLSRCEHGDALALTYGQNIGVPSVQRSSEYATRIYAFGSTRNITQDYQNSGTTNALVEKQLTLPAGKYPNGYKDIKPNLSPEEIIEKTVIFDDIYPSSDFAISDVRVKVSVDSTIEVGKDENGNPIYASMPVYFFKIAGIAFSEDLIIEGLTLKVHFLTGHLQGREFELAYHKDTSEYEIIVNQDGAIKLPNETLLPQDNDVVVLFNIVMPDEYVTSAENRLEAALDDYIEKKLLSDNNTYSFKSNPVTFAENNTSVNVGRKITLNHGTGILQSRILSIEYPLEYPSKVDISVGESIPQGKISSVETEVVNASSTIEIIQAYNNVAQTVQNLYARTQNQITEGLAKLANMWILDQSKDTTPNKTNPDVWFVRSPYDVVGLKGISAYGLGSTSGSGASGSLGELVNVGQWADEVPTADRVMVQLAGATHWSAKPLADLVGLDTAALAQYLTANSYLKASDISSYLTWANLSGKPTVYPTSWELVVGRPTKLSDLTDDVVAGNYLPKPTWDAVFEVVTVDGTPALKVKYDILGLKGITAYAEGSLSGGFSGALVDLVDVAVTNLASGEILKYNGTHFVNVPVSSIAGASSWDQITGKPEYYPTRWADVSGAPTSLPASDVYPWAKAASKPTYTAAEVGALALSGGTLTGNVITIGSFILANSGAYPQLTFRATADNSERLLFRHGNDLKWRYNGTNDGIIYHSGNFNPGNYLLLSGGTMTGDITFGSNGRSLRGSDGGNIAGVLYDTPNARYVTAIGTGSRRLILVSPASIYRGAGGVAENYMIYDSGNFNPSSKLDKSVWDEAFELKTVNGVRVISAKLDFLSVAGISAYATGPSSGGGGGGLDYDLLKQALTGAITPDGYPFTISASFLGAIDKTYLTGKLANTYADKVHTHLWADITDRPTSLPANGGNADTVDNLHASSFAQIKSYNFPSGGINNITDLDFTGNIQAHFPGAEYSCIWQGKDFAGTILQLKLRDYAGKQSMMYRGSLTKIWRTVWDSGNFNPDNKFGLSGIISDLNNAPLNAVFSTNGTPANAPLENAYFQGFTFAMDNNPDFKRQWAFKDKKIWFRNLHAGSWSAWTDVIPLDNYLPLSGGSITGGLGVSGYLTAGVLRVKATSYPQISFVNTTTNRDSLLFVNGSGLYWRPTAGTATDYQVYHSGNFNPDSKLGVSSVAVEAKKMSYQGLMTAISGTTTFPAGLYLYGVYNNGYPVTYGNLLRVGGSGLGEMLFGWAGDASVGGLYYRSKRDVAATAWSNWCKLWTSANSNLSTIDWSANNLNAAANLDVAGQAYVSGWLRSRGNVGWYSQDYGGGIHMTDSTWVRVYGSKGLMIDTGTSPINMGQLQITCSAEASIGFRSASNGNWCLGKGVKSIGSGFGLYNAVTNRAAFQIDSATDNASFVGSITAPTFVGNLSGSASSVNGYDINSFTGYYKYTIDASSLDQNTYYPVTMYLGNHNTVRISVIVALDSGTKPAWSSHASGYSVRFIEEVNGSGWGTSEVSRNILANEYRFANANPVGRVEQMTNSSTEVIWVRGGGKYFFYLSIPYITPALRTSTFTNASQSVSPRTDTMDLRMAANGNGIAVSKLYAHNSIEINGFTIDVYNGALRVNGNLVATGGVTAYQ
ncbi:hypothetical protein [Alistipes indistinctus]|uniref:hypothetical protein n=1 Tax=Alistipes indistinctus TaxID=626932 RepID=UPI003AEFAAF3